jgi:PKD repeat protein
MTDASEGTISSRHWCFGNNKASSLTDPSMEFDTPGTYVVTLLVSDGANTDSSSQVITAFAPPIADFKSDIPNACPKQAIHFTGLVNPGSTSISDLSWAFGNGISSSGNNVSCKYPAAGIYEVTLIAHDANGCLSSAKKNIEVANIKANFSASEMSTSPGEAIKFINQSSVPGAKWHWDFGDGTGSDEQNPIKAYSRPGIYSVTFVNKEGVCASATTHIDYIRVNTESTLGSTADKQ